MRLRTLFPIVVLLFALPAIAAESRPVAPAPREVPSRIVQVFAVGDLVIPPATAKGDEAQKAYAKNIEKLTTVLTEMVRPYSWNTAGGKGTIEYFDLGTSLVVTNTPEAIEEVRATLEHLRKLKAELKPQAKPAERQPVTIKLKNVAAVDAQHSMNKYLETRLQGTNQNVVVTAEPVSNTLLLRVPSSELERELLTAIAALDREPEQIVFSVVMMRVSRDFIAKTGLNKNDKEPRTSWTLSPREMHMLNELIRKEKAEGTCDILSRPSIHVCAGQIGTVQTGQVVPTAVSYELNASGLKLAMEPKVQTQHHGVTMKVTGSYSPDGKAVHLDTSVQVSGGRVYSELKLNAVAVIPVGHTLVLAEHASGTSSFTTALTRAYAGEPLQTVVIITPHRVQTATTQVRTLEWFTK